MKRLLPLISLLLIFQNAQAQGIDEKINRIFTEYTAWFANFIFYKIPFRESIQVPWVILVLVIGAIYFTVYFKGINATGFMHSVNIVLGKYDGIERNKPIEASETVHAIDGDQPDTIRIEGHHGEVSHFQALTAALSGTLGLGNIAGVAVALSIGGPGATFWMIISGLLGMSSKFVECTLGVKYRDIDSNGIVYGGPMYYLTKGLAEMGMKKLGKFLAIVFAIMCVGGALGGGNMFQANQTFKIFQHVTGGEASFMAGYGWAFGTLLAILVGVVVIGGIKSIAQVAEKIVPFMVLVYAIASFVVIGNHIQDIPAAFSEIISGAFTGVGILGGAVGVMIQGFKRASFSNEAGIGSASIAHSAVKTKFAASEGLVSLLEPFVDTVVVCTMTALVIVVSNRDGSVMQYGTEIPDGVIASSKAFANTISWFPYVLAISVLLFAFATMISWSYYGFQAWVFLFGRSKISGTIYNVIFCLCVVIGSAAGWGAVIDFSDAMIFAMLVPNMIGLFLLAPRVVDELKLYLEAVKSRKK